MKIANPIYDTVFKYLLTNNTKVAKLIISSLIGRKIIELTINPTEVIATKKKRKPLIGTKASYTVLRLDFAARIKNDDGTEELILIEMQKAKLITDIMRFRKYLGSQYMNEEHTFEINGKEYALPIYPIYFLGHKLDGFDQEAIMIKRRLYDAVTNEEISKRSDFINSLSHDGIVIQIPCVSQNIKKSNRAVNKHLIELLMLFDQDRHYANDKHFLDIEKADLPKWMEPIARELEKATKDGEVRNQMQLEDDWVADLENMERQIEDSLKVIENKDKMIEDKNRVIEDQEKMIKKLMSELENK